MSTCRRSPALVLSVAFLLSALAETARPQPALPDTRAQRRTPAVEVFENWKDSVAFVTGPIIKAGQPAAEEFFVPANQKSQEQSVGTGFVLHESGYLVTNAHAVERLIAPFVVLSDGKRYPAEVVAALHGQDLAVLKIEAGRPLKAVQLGRSGDVMIGETVVVIANPHGLLRTCTVGVVSAAGRNTHLADVPGVTLQDMIQSDAGINPGSSGGPWFNVAGEMIGITSSMKRDAENIAFAISVATLRRTLPEMLDLERRQGFVTGLEVAADGPCQVTAVAAGGPAAEVGLRVGDVLTQVAGRPTPTGADYQLALISRKPKESLTVELVREGKWYQTAIPLAPRAKPDGAALLKQRLGLTAVPLDEAKARSMGLRVCRGVRVTAVEPKLYEKLPMKPEPGDVLARIGPIRPRDLDHAGLLLENVKPGQRLELVLCRHKDNVGTRINFSLVLP